MELRQRASLAPFRDGVLQARDAEAVTLGKAEIAQIKAMAEKAKLRRARICIHTSDDDVLHEMLICMYRDSKVGKHRHATEESYLVLDGHIRINLYRQVSDTSFDCFGALDLGGPRSGLDRYGRIRAGMWHEPQVMSPYVVMLETAQGPWRKE